MEEKNKDRFILVSSIISVIAIIWMLSINFIQQKQTTQFNLSLQQLRGVAKLVIWEQDFQLNDITEKEKKYFNLFTTKESIATTVNGRMGFHINLSDSINTTFSNTKDTIYIKAPLLVTYISIDAATIKQVKESSLDPSLEVDKIEIIKQLNQRALQKYLPQINATIQSKPLTSQEQSLSKLCNKPVKIIITKMPTANTVVH